ncbi:MAG: hypothetical protein ACK4NS_04270 [Saprospiraceae bacterium]
MKVKAYIGSQIAHTSQIFTGLAMLRKAGKIALFFSKDPLLGKSAAIQRCEVDGRLLVFDLADGFVNDPVHYASCDLYFKRMLAPDTPDPLGKLRPYGLNYPVHTAGDTSIRRAWISGDKRRLMEAILRSSVLLSRLFNINLSHSTSQVRHFEGRPAVNAHHPRVIYFTRLWDPSKVKDERLKAQREVMNAMRRALVRALRDELKDQFIGGIYRTEFSAAFAPAETAPDNRALHKAAYLKALRASDIGIADYGLEMSVGFKMAEYVAMSKAIVSSPVNTLLPGSFEQGKNYLAYDTVEECLNHCVGLIRRPELILEMQRHNADYYRQYLRPDQLVWNCLTTA